MWTGLHANHTDVRVYGRLTTITNAVYQRVVDNWCFSPWLQDGNSQTSIENNNRIWILTTWKTTDRYLTYHSVLSKLLEKAVFCQLQDHLKSNDLYSPYQPAHRTWHSTETALTHVSHQWPTSPDGRWKDFHDYVAWPVGSLRHTDHEIL